MYTGQPSITIPIWTISSGDISQTASLSYNANSAQQESPFGAGWSLLAGGSISREVRTFPDDIGYLATTQGWLYNNVSGVNIASDINSFVPTADTLAGVREAGEGTDFTKINGFNYLVDTEPDIFNYSFGGMSGSFLIDNGLVIRTMPYQDIKIAINQLNSTDKRILGFTITSNTGFVYTFDYKLSATKSTSESMYANRNFYIPTEYELYNPSVAYTREWKLTRIDSPDGAYMTFGYVSMGTDNQTNNVDIGMYQYPDPAYADPSDIVIRTVYSVQELNVKACLANIVASTGPKIEFIYNGTLQSIKISDDRRGATPTEKYIKSFVPSYQPVLYVESSIQGEFVEKTAQFLFSITEYSSCEKMAPHKFSYTGVRYVDNLTSSYPGYHLPSTEGIDLWGYPNSGTASDHLFPKLYIYPTEPAAERYRIDPIPGYAGQQVILEGANRHSSSAGMLPGTLQSITSPEGGVTSFTFEANQYLDTRTNLNSTAGGLRIGMISYFDGFNPVPVKKYFEYKDPVTGLSSGRLIRRPQFAMPAFKWKSSVGLASDKVYETVGMTSDEKWKYLTIRTTADLTPSETTHGNTVGYKVVTVKRPGAGSARHEYNVPAIHGQYVSGTWKSTTNRFARYSSAPTMGIVSDGGPWMFPYTANPDFDYERGLVWRKTEFNEAGVRVKQTETTYQYLFRTGTTPLKVSGLKYDRYAGCDNDNKIFFYGKYSLLTETLKVPKKEIVTTYDITDGTGATYLTESTEYVYGSTNHKLLTQVKQTASDGNISTTRLKYPNDYTYTTTGASEAVMIGNLKTANRHGIPLEQIQTVKKGSDSTRVVGGSVVKLDPMGLSRPLVRSTWKLKTNPTIRIDSFQHSAVVNASGYKFKIDPRYERTDSILSYTATGNIKASRNSFSRQISVTGYGYSSSIPVVQLINGSDGQAAFSDFETITGFEFSSATAYYGTGRTGAKAFYPWVMLSKTIIKAPVNNYILSFWVKSNAAVTFNIYLKNTSGSPTYYNTTLATSSTGSEYQYFRKVIPITVVTVSSFTIEVQAVGLSAPPAGNPAAGGVSASLLPVIDDVFFYPETAEMVATTFKIPFGATSVTTGAGNTSYNEYDKLGRLRFVYDKNKNIVKRNVYLYNEESPLVADFSIPYPYSPTTGISTTFTAATNECVTDATYEWNWGSGYVPGTATQAHTFATAGSYTVTLKVTSATYGSKTLTKNITAVNPAFEVSICAKGPIHFTGGTADVIATCVGITSTPPSNGTIFKVYHDGAGTLTFQWKRRDFGASTWVNVGGNSSECLIRSLSSSPSFEIMCEINSSVLGTGYSPAMEVIIQP